MYEIILSDSQDTWTLPELEVPLTSTPIVLSTDVTVLSNDIYTDVFPMKRSGSHTWSYMSKEDYDRLFAFYYRQMAVTYQYPRITINELNIKDMVAKIEVGSQNIINHCGEVEGVSFSFRESNQNFGRLHVDSNGYLLL